MFDYLGFDPMDIDEELVDFLEHMGNGFYQTWNDYCDSVNKPEHRVMDMGFFDEWADGLTPSDIADAVTTSDFSINNRLFRETMYGLESSDDIEDLMEDSFENVAEDILEHPEHYYDKVLKEFLATLIDQEIE